MARRYKDNGLKKRSRIERRNEQTLGQRPARKRGAAARKSKRTTYKATVSQVRAAQRAKIPEQLRRGNTGTIFQTIGDANRKQAPAKQRCRQYRIASF